MAAPATPTFLLNWLNTWFKRLDRAHNASIIACPTLASMTFEKTGGETVAQPFVLNGHRGEAGNFQAAQAVASQSQFRNSAKYRWLVPYGDGYFGSVQVAHRDIALSRSDRDAAARAMEHETNMAFKQRAANIMRVWYANLGASIGQATLASGVLTFTDRYNAAKLFQGDVVSLSANDGDTSTDTVVGSPGYVVKSESEVASASTGKISISASSAGAVGNPSGVVDGTYYVFRYGEFNSADTNAIVTPIQAYLPAAPSTADLHNVKRANDTRLCGLRMPDSQLQGRSIGSKIKLFIANAQVVAGVDQEIDTVVLNPLDWALAEEEFTSTVSREVVETTEDGFSKITINTPNGKCKLLSEPFCPQGIMFFFSSGQLVFHSPTGMICQWADEDGSIVRRKENELVYEMVPVTYLATVMKAPYCHGRASTTI